MKKMLIFTFLTLMLFSSIILAAQSTGTIAGRVTDESGKSLAEVSVFISETKAGTYTKDNGSFILKDVPAGLYTVHVSYMGYGKSSKKVTVEAGITSTINFSLTKKAIEIEGFRVTATRAVERETPIAFTNVSESDIQNKYTTQDIPQLLEGVPGLFSASGGLGEGDLYMRGFDPDKVQILINGIPVNDPESQQVYWSNWTGLSSNVKSIQVQRGVGSSMYGSGAFGGSVNIETLSAGAEKDHEFTLRTSIGSYFMDETETADGNGGFDDYDPVNYNILLRYKSGRLFNGKFNYSLMFERKAGDSYIHGTNYDGYSFGAEAQSVFGAHNLNYSFIGAPQKHNQAYASSDMELMKTLGRNYNRNNCKEQENHYFKPQFSIRDEWSISDEQLLMTNFFFTMGRGGGRYLRNDSFDVNTGEVTYKSTSGYTDNKYFGRHARYVYEKTVVILDGYDPDAKTYNIDWYVDDDNNPITADVSKARNLLSQTYNHSWFNDSNNNHDQLGLNTYYQHQAGNMFRFVVGGEFRYWKADHFAESFDFRYANGIYDEVEKRYDYTTSVLNFSGFLRSLIKPTEALTFTFDGQYASYTSKVEENAIKIFDFGKGEFTNESYYASKDTQIQQLDEEYDPVVDSEGNPVMINKFSDDDFQKTYDFFSPKLGLNYNDSDYFNFFVNYSIAYKEPRVTDWYSRSSGPDANQTYYEDYIQADGDTVQIAKMKTLNPEKSQTIEFGTNYKGEIFDIGINYYITDYKDRIEFIYSRNNEPLTINAGNARQKGLELSIASQYDNLDFSGTLSLAENRWTEMNVEEIFGASAEDIVDKIVPFSPEEMINSELGYTLENLPAEGKLRVGLGFNWWDEYYGNYTNEYEVPTDQVDDEGNTIFVTKEAKLPYYFSLNSNIKYSFKLGSKDASLRLDFKNITNRTDNYSKASFNSDYNRNDELAGINYMYVAPAPLFNVFFTMEVNF